MSYDDSHEKQPTERQRMGMRNGILCQVFGNMGQQAFVNGVILVYLAYYSISDSRIAFYLAIPFGFVLCNHGSCGQVLIRSSDLRFAGDWLIEEFLAVFWH